MDGSWDVGGGSGGGVGAVANDGGVGAGVGAGVSISTGGGGVSSNLSVCGVPFSGVVAASSSSVSFVFMKCCFCFLGVLRPCFFQGDSFTPSSLLGASRSNLTSAVFSLCVSQAFFFFGFFGFLELRLRALIVRYTASCPTVNPSSGTTTLHLPTTPFACSRSTQNALRICPTLMQRTARNCAA